MTSAGAPLDGAAHRAVTTVLADAQAPHREVAPGEWGVTLDAGGWPLHVGIALRDGLVRAQAEVVGPGRLDPAELLHRHRRGALVRFATTRAGAVWVMGEVPAATADAAAVDQLLARLVESADWARDTSR